MFFELLKTPCPLLRTIVRGQGLAQVQQRLEQRARHTRLQRQVGTPKPGTRLAQQHAERAGEWGGAGRGGAGRGGAGRGGAGGRVGGAYLVWSHPRPNPGSLVWL